MFGALKDKPDSRDYDFSKPRLATASILPDGAFIEAAYLPPSPGNQGTIGACVAWACVAVREILIRRMAPDTTLRLSPLFLYYEARKLGGIEGDGGSYLRDGFKAMANVGVCPESEWPYDTTKVLETPPEGAYLRAINYRIYNYRRLVTLDDMKKCLSSGFPFSLSMAVFNGGLAPPMPLQWNVLRMPEAGQEPIAGHVTAIEGYNQQYLLARNSWGPDWGGQGHLWIPFDYVAKYMWDAWMAEA